MAQTSFPILDKMLDSYCLYNRQIDEFFHDASVFRYNLNRGEDFIGTVRLEKGIVAYVSRGLFKLFVLSEKGDSSFTGFIPRYSTITATSDENAFGKQCIANIDSEVLIAPLNSYVDFIRSSAELTLHQIHEPFYRRNINDIPRNFFLHYHVRVRVSGYILTTVLCFGARSVVDERRWSLRYPPNYKEIASYIGANANNVSSCLTELERAGLIERTPRELIIPDVALFHDILNQMREQS